MVEATSGRPTPGALVTLVAADARRVAPTLSGEDGAYVAVAPAAGEYRVRVDLIGYEAWQSAPISLGAVDTATVDVRLPLRRVELATVKVEAQSRCETRPEQAPRLLALWEEVRRALTLSDISQQRGLVPLDLTLRGSTQLNKAVAARNLERVRAAGARPWRARSAADLAANGYVRWVDGEYQFIGVDVPILLAAPFVETHCFRPVRRRSEIGLTFEPVPGRATSDVKGTIWLDERSSELRRVDFGFVNVPDSARAQGDATGTLEFARLPTGAWYVRRWEMSQQTTRRGMRYAREMIGYAEPVQRGAPSDQKVATLQGRVVDSTSGDGLAGAAVHVPGMEPVWTDSLGRFRMGVDGLPAQAMDYVVRVEHPRFTRLGIAAAEHRVTLFAGETATLDVAVPSMPTLLATFCRDGEGDGAAAAGPAGILLGRAVSPSGMPVADGARVVAEWPSDEALGEGAATRLQQRSVAVGEDGTFRLCPLPLARPLMLRVERGSARGPGMEVVLPKVGIGEVELVAAVPE